MPIRKVRKDRNTPLSSPDAAKAAEPTAPPKRRVRPVTRAALSAKVADDADASAETRSPPHQGEYKVGYSKPPLHSRFRKGVSGNPRGRMAGSKNEKTLVREILGKKIPVRTPEGQRRLNSFEISLIKLREKAAQGDIRAIREVLGYLARISAASEQDTASGNGSNALTSAEEQILTYLLGGAAETGSHNPDVGND